MSIQAHLDHIGGLVREGRAVGMAVSDEHFRDDSIEIMNLRQTVRDVMLCTVVKYVGKRGTIHLKTRPDYTEEDVDVWVERPRNMVYDL